MKYRETQRAEMSPDIYAGENCDQVRPRWAVSAEGDMDSDFSDTIEFDAKHFPPGTKVVISEPLCPQCEDLSVLCDCGFDWEGWTRETYS